MLLLVLIIGRYASLTIADAILAVAPIADETPPVAMQDGAAIAPETAILQARNSLWNAIYRAQREALAGAAAP